MKIFNKTIIIILICNILLLFAQDEISFSKRIVGGNYLNVRKLEIEIKKKGNINYTFEKELLPYQSIPQVLLIDSTKFCLAFIGEGLVEFYKDGKITNKYNFYKSHQHNEQRMYFANNAFGTAVLVSENLQNKIFLFDLIGNLKDSIDAGNGIISGFSLSDNNNFIAYSYYNWEIENLNNTSVIMNSNNNKIFTTDEKFWQGKFNLAENKFLGFTNKSSFCYDVTSNKILWKSDLPNDEIYLDGIWENNNTLLIKAGSPELKDGNWVHNKANIIEKNNNGDENIIQNVSLSFTKINFEKSQNKILLKADEKLIEFKK